MARSSNSPGGMKPPARPRTYMGSHLSKPMCRTARKHLPTVAYPLRSPSSFSPQAAQTSQANQLQCHRLLYHFHAVWSKTQLSTPALCLVAADSCSMKVPWLAVVVLASQTVFAPGACSRGTVLLVAVECQVKGTWQLLCSCNMCVATCSSQSIGPHSGASR